MAFYQALKATGSPILKAAYHPWIRGKENIPAEGPAILASNHNAVWDSVFLPMMLDREVVFMGKADYFTGTGVKGWMTKEFMRAVGTIPVDRTGGRASESALNAGLKRLRSGELFGIYPEGAFEGPVPSNGRPAPGGRTAPDVPVPTAPEEEPSEEENKEDSSK